MKRNARGGYVAPPPGGHQRENAATFGSGTVPMVETATWTCNRCGCAQERAEDGTLRRRICQRACDCHAEGIGQP